MNQREISNEYFDKNFPELRNKILNCIKTTLVISNKGSTDIAVKKIIDILDPELIKQYGQGYSEGQYDILNKQIMTTYTNEEIQKNIETLSNRVDSLKLDRTELTRLISELRKQVLYWQELDKSQYKMFE